MRTHVRVALPALVLALLLAAAPSSQAQPKPGRDLAQLMPADPMLYFEMDHKNLTKHFHAVIKGSALSDYAAFRDTLYKKNKLEAGDAGSFDFKLSAIVAFILAPEFLDELGRMNGHALAITDVVDTRGYPEPKFLWVIDSGTSHIPPLIVRDVLTLMPNMKSVRTVEGVRIYQPHYREYEYDKEGKRTGPKEGKIVPSSPVLASMPGLIVVGSDPDAVADVILRAKGKTVKTPALADAAEFKQVAHLRAKKQLFGYANLKKVYKRTGAFFGFDATVLALEGLLGPESHKDLAAAFWLENNNPHLEFAIQVDPAKTGMLTRLVSGRTINPGVLHYAPDTAFGTLTVPVFKDSGDWPKLMSAVQRAARKYSVRSSRDDGPALVSITPDGNYAVTVVGGSQQGHELWDTAAGKEIPSKAIYVFHGLASLAISPDGKRFVLVEGRPEDARPKVLDAAKGTLIHVLGNAKKDAPWVTCAAFSPDGKRIVTGEGAWVKEWSADTGEEVRSRKLHEIENKFGHVTCVAFTPAGDIISGGNDKLVKIWWADGKVNTLIEHAQGISAISVSKDGKRIISADNDGGVKVSDSRGAAIASFMAGKKGEGVRCVTISPDGQRVVTAGPVDYSKDQPSSPIKTWDLNKGNAKETLVLKGHQAAVCSLVFGADGKTIVSGDQRGNIKVWNPADGTELSSMPLSTLEILARRFGNAIAATKGTDLLANVQSVTIAFAESPLVIVEMKDAAAAKLLVDTVPLLVSKGQVPQKKNMGKNVIHSLPEGNNYLEWPLSYGQGGNMVVFGATPASVAAALDGGSAKRGFAAQPDVARTLASVKDVNGLLLWSGRNMLLGGLKADETLLNDAVKKGIKPAQGNEFERALLALYPKQLKKLGADIDKITADLPAGSLTVTAQADKLTISGSQPGLTKILPRLIDAWVEWDLTRPSFRHEFQREDDPPISAK